MSILAEEYQTIAPGLFFWSAFDPAVKTDLSCSAYVQGDGLILIDPIPLAEPAWEELQKAGQPRAIFLTNENHARAADQYRQRHQIPVIAPPLAKANLGLKADVYVMGTDVIYGLTPLSIPGATPGETAYHHPKGFLFLGDAVINNGSGGLSLLPDKYCSDPNHNRESLKKLLSLSFSIVTFAHGLPLRTNAQSQLQNLLA
jgi:glyoxylase-like metal-dependent hydrolase (beta-lactamase superfamily II)